MQTLKEIQKCAKGAPAEAQPLHCAAGPQVREEHEQSAPLPGGQVACGLRDGLRNEQHHAVTEEPDVGEGRQTRLKRFKRVDVACGRDPPQHRRRLRVKIK